MLVDRLRATQYTGEKSLVFSQWTAFLDLLEIALRRKGIPYVRLDGTLNLAQREKALAKFRDQDSGYQVGHTTTPFHGFQFSSLVLFTGVFAVH